MGGHRRPILSIYTELHTIFPDQLMAQFQRVVTIIESEVMSKFQRLLHDTMPKVNNKVLCTENFTERGSILCYHKKKKSGGNIRKLVEVMDIFITWMVMVTRMYTYVQTN